MVAFRTLISRRLLNILPGLRFADRADVFCSLGIFSIGHKSSLLTCARPSGSLAAQVRWHPVVAIEGNHDKAFISSDALTWLDYLAQDELLYILKPSFDATGVQLSPWDKRTKRGAYVDLGGIRFVGAGYLGAATPHKVRQIAEKLDAEHSHILFSMRAQLLCGRRGRILEG
jgi:hypothetical protein